MLSAIIWTQVGIRAAAIAGALVLWFWTQSLIGRKSVPKQGIGDLAHDLTSGWHARLLANTRGANAALIVSSAFIDLMSLGLIGAAIFGGTLAPFLAILLLFGLRQICQAFSTLPPPPGIIWRHPGFPALLVTYGVGNDFFFSGHTALAVLAAIEAAHLGPVWLAVGVAIIATAEAVLVLVLRAHYTLDVVAGALAAYFAADVAGKLSPVVDAWFR